MAIETESKHKLETTSWANDLRNYEPRAEHGVIVEIGPALFPVFMFSRNVLEQMKRNHLYIGIDNDPGFQPVKKIGEYLTGSLFDLPLASNSADQIWLMNIFGDMERYRFYHSPFVRTHNGSIVPNLHIQKSILELERVLKPQGTILIGEYYEEKAQWLKNINYRDFGLEKRQFEGKNINQFTNKHSITSVLEYLTANDAFFIELRKDPNLRGRRSGI